MREKIDEILAEFVSTSLYTDAENRYTAALAHVDKNIADEIEHAISDMTAELMSAAYARGAADARKILCDTIMHAANDLPKSELPAIVETFLNLKDEELDAIAILHKRSF